MAEVLIICDFTIFIWFESSKDYTLTLETL